MAALQDLKKYVDEFPEPGKTMPILFIGHGSPMNAIEDTEFSAKWKTLGTELPRPRAILCISAHWETRGTFVTAMEKPETIHDFGGFPDELFAVQYPAPGSPVLAQQTKDIIKKAIVELDTTWGLDHGCWSVVRRIYPNADIPVLQLSLDHFQSPQWHYDLAKDLASLRNKGILIIGSGNMVHNLGRVNWQHPDSAYDWAQEANDKFKQYINDGEHSTLIHYESLGKAVMLSVPTPEHFLPMLYILGLKQKSENIEFFNDKTVMGSLSMTSFKIS
ncbi:MAG: 4,5-DOPA dioxygenase extradiol [Bacteroidota bacterium]